MRVQDGRRPARRPASIVIGRILPFGGPGTRNVPVEKAVLALTLAVMAALVVYRTIDLWLTGFFVPDEYGYIDYALRQDTLDNPAYGSRWFFAWFNLLVFRVFRLNGVPRFIATLPFFLFLWISIAIIAFYLTMKTMRVDSKAIALSLFSSLFLVAFVLLSLGFISEPVGLAMAMVGILLLFQYQVHRTEFFRANVCVVLAAASFGAAAGSREPYSIFLLLTVAAVFLAGIGGVKNKGGRARRLAMVAVPVILFAGSGYVLLHYPRDLSFQGFNIVADLGKTIVSRFVNIGTTTSSTSTNSSGTASPTTTMTVTSSQSAMSNATSSTATSSTTNASTVSSTVTTAQTSTVGTTYSTSTETNPPATGGRGPGLVNAALIFSLGLVLGWGPLLALLGLGGLVTLLYKFARAERTRFGFVLFLALLSLGTYAFVAFAFSYDPSYLSFGHYSTLIRFSDTALPAYFLLAPFSLSLVMKKRIYVAVAVTSLILFTTIAFPLFTSYTQSNIGVEGNLFSLGFRMPGALARDYFQAHITDGPFYVIGLPPAVWFWTPGSADLPTVHILPYLNLTEFTKLRPTTFYLYGYDLDVIQGQAPYLLQFVLPNQAQRNYTNPQLFTVQDHQLIFDSNSNFMVKIQLTWSGNATVGTNA